MRLCYWGERKLIADHKNKIILMINENNEVIPFPYKWAGGSAEVVSIYPLVRLCFPKSLKNRGSPYWDTIHYDRDIQYRIAYFPDMSVMFNKILVGDYFSKFGLKIEVIDSDTFIVLTEPGIIHQMQQRVPHKILLEVPGLDGCSCNACPYMRLNTLEKLKACLETLTPAIEMDESMRLKAMKPMQRMLEMSR